MGIISFINVNLFVKNKILWVLINIEKFIDENIRFYIFFVKKNIGNLNYFKLIK